VKVQLPAGALVIDVVLNIFASNTTITCYAYVPVVMSGANAGRHPPGQFAVPN
jgi:hypothetical protein